MTQPPSRLRVEADLQLSFDGTRATLTGDGDRLVLASDSPAAVWEAVTAAALPQGASGAGGVRAAGLAAEALRGAGVQVDVRGPSGSVVRLGDGVTSSLGRVVTGSSAVGPGSPRALAPLVVHRVRQDRRLLVAVGVLALTAGAAALSARRRK